MAKYITQLAVSLDATDEKRLQAEQYRKLFQDLNKGTGGNPIYLWYKAEPTSAPITRLQVTFNDAMAVGLINAGYSKIPQNLNQGTKGNNLFLWYFRGKTEFDTPISEIDVTTDAQNEAHKFNFGWQRVSCDLNRNAGGNWIHIWLKRAKQTYICDVTATDNYGSDVDLFEGGYIRVDENTNRGAGGAKVFLWYRQTTEPQRAINDLQVSTNKKDYQAFQEQHYEQVTVDLNQGTKGNQVYLWYKANDVNNPIKSIILLLNPAAFKVYEEAGINVIEKNLNAGNNGRIEHLAVYQ